MKMSEQHYRALEAKIRPFQMAIESHIATLKANGGYKDLETRVIFDVFHAAKIYNDFTYQEFDYNDSHIKTAVRAILKDMGLYGLIKGMKLIESEGK